MTLYRNVRFSGVQPSQTVEGSRKENGCFVTEDQRRLRLDEFIQSSPSKKQASSYESGSLKTEFSRRPWSSLVCGYMNGKLANQSTFGPVMSCTWTLLKTGSKSNCFHSYTSCFRVLPVVHRSFIVCTSVTSHFEMILLSLKHQLMLVSLLPDISSW